MAVTLFAIPVRSRKVHRAFAVIPPLLHRVDVCATQHVSKRSVRESTSERRAIDLRDHIVAEVHEDTPFNAQEHVKRVKTPSELSSELSTISELSTNLRDLHVRPLDQSRCGRYAAHRARIVRVSWRNTRPRSSRRCSVARTTCALRATPRASGFSRSMGVQTAHGLLLGGMEARTEQNIPLESISQKCPSDQKHPQVRIGASNACFAF